MDLTAGCGANMKYSTQNQMSKAGKPRNTNKRQGWIKLNYLTILSATSHVLTPPHPSSPLLLWWMSRVGQLLWAHAGIRSIITPEPIVSPECGRPRNCWHVSSRRVQSSLGVGIITCMTMCTISLSFWQGSCSYKTYYLLSGLRGRC